MTGSDLAKSYVRTVVPIVVGAIITWALRHGVDLNGYAWLVEAAVTATYYTAFRLAEHYLSRQFGWLLGAAGGPRYPRLVRGDGKDTGHGAVDLLALVLAVILAVWLITALVH